MTKNDGLRGSDRSAAVSRQVKPCRPWRNAVLPLRCAALWVLAWAALMAGPATAHIVPPEKLHPVAEAYRRATFVLNLNPVAWEQVRPDVKTIATYWAQSDPKAGEEFLAKANAVIAEATKQADEEKGIEPMPRAEAAAKVFGLMTTAVAGIGQAKLDAAVHQLRDRDAAQAAMREAQGILAAFDDILQAADPDAFRRLGQSWLSLSNSLGAPGLLGQGTVDIDRERFAAEVKQVTSYINENFSGDYVVPQNMTLAAWPAKSKTFIKTAKLPVKLPPGNNINKQLPRPRQILNMVARGVDEKDTALIALGDMAFDSPHIFSDPARTIGLSCNSCHNKSITNPNFSIPGLSERPGGVDVDSSYFAPHFSDGVFDPLDIPDLRGIRFTAPYGRDGRFASLRDFVRNTIANEFGGKEPDPMIVDGMVAYMLQFDFLPNPALNKDGTLNDKAPPAAARGETIFNRPFAQMKGMSCASCHLPSSNFVDGRQHDIGAFRGSDPDSRDRALDTPTLLGIKYTAPYFHDGSRPTLRSVNEYFNDSYKLGLDKGELDDLTAYVETVGSGTDAMEDTTHTLEAEMEEFSFFISPYEFLVAKEKPELINITFQTISEEIRAHKWDLQDYQYLPVLDRMADTMDQAYAANRKGDRPAVDQLVLKYREIYEKYKNVLK